MELGQSTAAEAVPCTKGKDSVSSAAAKVHEKVWERKLELIHQSVPA